MKKIVFIFTVILSVYLIYQLFEVYLDSLDKQVFTKLTNISKFDVITDVREDRFFYIIAKVSPADKKVILSTHHFKSSPIDLKGHLAFEINSINENDYLYYLDDVGHGYLGYVLYLVSKTDNTLIVYTSYAD